MIKHNQKGEVNALVISLVLAALLLIGALVFGGWAYSGRQDYKNNVDAKIRTAQAATRQQEDTVKDQQFAEEAKKPLRLYQGPEAYGSLMVYYPKTWSGYVDDRGSSGGQVEGYFAPGVVPTVNDSGSVFSLRFEIVSSSYDQVMQTLSGQQQNGKLTVSAYALPQLPKVVGAKVVGQIDSQTNVTMVIFPLRSQTLKLWTEGNQYLNDFNNNILPSFKFSP